jgi:Ca2+-binding EF-hand superfamily protein
MGNFFETCRDSASTPALRIVTYEAAKGKKKAFKKITDKIIAGMEGRLPDCDWAVYFRSSDNRLTCALQFRSTGALQNFVQFELPKIREEMADVLPEGGGVQYRDAGPVFKQASLEGWDLVHARSAYARVFRFNHREGEEDAFSQGFNDILGEFEVGEAAGLLKFSSLQPAEGGLVVFAAFADEKALKGHVKKMVDMHLPGLKSTIHSTTKKLSQYDENGAVCGVFDRKALPGEIEQLESVDPKHNLYSGAVTGGIIAKDGAEDLEHGGFNMNPSKKAEVDGRSSEERAREVFDLMDTDGNGTLGKKEFSELMENMGHKMTSLISDKDLESAWKDLDANNDGSVSFEEFLAWYRRKHPETKDDLDLVLKWEFDMIDADGSGSLNKAEVGKLMKRFGLKTGGTFFGHKKLDAAFKEMSGSDDPESEVDVGDFADWYHSRFQIRKEQAN